MAEFIKIGESKLITASVTDAAGDQVADPSLTWSSSNTAVVQVQESARGPLNKLSERRATITGISAGSATITCTNGSVSGTLTVTVHNGAATTISIRG